MVESTSTPVLVSKLNRTEKKHKCEETDFLRRAPNHHPPSLSLSLSLSHSVTPSVSGTMHQFLMCVAPEPQVFFHPRANRITITTFLDISRSGSRRRRQSRLVSSSSFEREFFSFSSSDSSSFSSPSTCCCYEGYFVPRDGFEYDQNQFRNLFKGHVSYKISDVRRQTSDVKQEVVVIFSGQSYK